MAIKNRMKTDPVPVVRQIRDLNVRDVTTMRPGKIYPIAAFNLLRMDACMGRLDLAFNVAETYETLLNRLNVKVDVFFFPHVANERFERNPTMFERSFAGEPKSNDDGADVIPYFETHAFPATAGSHEVYKALGLTAKPGALVNTAYQEAYNQNVNYLRRQRSKSLPMVELDNSDLVPAMWGSSAFSEVVPDFDDAMIAGEVPLTLTVGNLPIRAHGIDGSGAVTPLKVKVRADGTVDKANLVLTNDAGVGAHELYTSLSADGVTVSLANVDQARELVKWAKQRENYEGHLDEWNIDALMQGITVEDMRWLQPMQIDSQTVKVVQQKRMAQDGQHLEDGAANGLAMLSVGVNVPQNPYGGVIMLLAQVLPDQLYERQADPYFTTTSVAQLPNYMQDVLNPVPVVKVLNKEVDVDHDTPEGQFGWAKRNWKWGQWPTRVGGDLYAPNADAATNVARRMIYPTDVENPALTTEFYLSTTLGMSPFMDQEKDPITVGIGGTITVSGLTVIGEVHESEANYDEVRSQVLPLQNPKE